MAATARCQPFAACVLSYPIGQASVRPCSQARAQRAVLQPRRIAPPAVAARRRLCRATAEKEGMQQQQEGQPQVPDTPPTPTGAAQRSAAAADSGANSPQGEPSVSIEDIQQGAAMYRQQKREAEAKEGLLQGVMEEVGLIKWPAPVKAVLNTFLVIVIVAGTGAALLAINTLLAELADVLY